MAKKKGPAQLSRERFHATNACQSDTYQTILNSHEPLPLLTASNHDQPALPINTITAPLVVIFHGQPAVHLQVASIVNKP